MPKRSKQAIVQAQQIPLYKHKGLRRTVLLLMMTGLIVGFGRNLSLSEMFPIETIRAQGSFVHVNEKMLNAAINEVDGTGFFELDVAHVQQQVEKLAWVKRASVRRVWPDTLIVSIQERKPVAVLVSGGLIDSKGEVFRPRKDSYPQGLPVFYVSEENIKTSLGYYFDSLAMLNKMNIRVNKVIYSDRHALSFVLDDSYELVLGRENKLYRLTRFAKVYKANIQKFKNNIAHIDMRYTNGLSIEWKAGQQPVENKSIARQQGSAMDAKSMNKKNGESDHV